MAILVINAGSSSVKFKLFQSTDNAVLSSGQLKNYSAQEYSFESYLPKEETKTILNSDYENSFNYIVNFLKEKAIISDNDEIEFVVHRIVHGGEEFDKPAELTTENIAQVEKYNEFAPLHNPIALEIVKKIHKDYPTLKQFGVFDTSFHLTNAKEQFLYGLPYGYYENIRVRRYGFHGTSYKYVVSTISKTFDNAQDLLSNAIVCHLGSGSSICAIKDGKSFDHSFGFTPTENLIMSTRSGEVDYDAVNFVQKKLGLNETEIETLLNQESGLLGISGYAKDMKQLLDDYNTNERAKLAVDMYVNKIVEHIGRFFVMLKGCNMIVFTGGVGSGSDIVRKMIIEKCSALNFVLNQSENEGKQDVADFLDITGEQSRAKIYVVPTNEELQMVREIDI